MLVRMFQEREEVMCKTALLPCQLPFRRRLLRTAPEISLECSREAWKRGRCRAKGGKGGRRPKEDLKKKVVLEQA